MIFLLSSFYQHVVNVDLDIPPNLLCKHFVHKPFGTSCLHSSGRMDHFITEEALAGYERSFLLISFMHSDLDVTQENVYKA